MANTTNLEWLVGASNKETFLGQYLEAKPFVVKRGDSNYYSELLTLENIKSQLRNVALGSYGLKLVKDGALIPQSSYSHITKVQNVEIKTAVNLPKLHQLYEGGATLVFDAFHNIWAPMMKFSNNMGQEFMCNVGVNVYLTPGNSRGFSSHYDTHDVFILQVHGSKHWKIYQSPIELPLNNQHYQFYQYSLGDPILELDLEQGDLLYMPRGFVHEGNSNHEESAHVSLGLYTTTWAKMMLDYITDFACNNSEIRSGFLMNRFNPGIDKEDKFNEIKARLLESLTLGALEDIYQQRTDKTHEVYFK